MEKGEDQAVNKEIPAINRCLTVIFKSIDKLQTLGVACNVTYCLPHSGAVITRGWDTIADKIVRTISSEDYKTFSEVLQRDLASMKTSAPVSSKDPRAVLGDMPSALTASRDHLRPLLTEMVRISQSKGNIYCFQCYRKTSSFFKFR